MLPSVLALLDFAASDLIIEGRVETELQDGVRTELTNDVETELQDGLRVEVQ